MLFVTSCCCSCRMIDCWANLFICVYWILDILLWRSSRMGKFQVSTTGLVRRRALPSTWGRKWAPAPRSWTQSRLPKTFWLRMKSPWWDSSPMNPAISSRSSWSWPTSCAKPSALAIHPKRMSWTSSATLMSSFFTDLSTWATSLRRTRSSTTAQPPKRSSTPGSRKTSKIL